MHVYFLGRVTEILGWQLKNLKIIYLYISWPLEILHTLCLSVWATTYIQLTSLTIFFFNCAYNVSFPLTEVRAHGFKAAFGMIKYSLMLQQVM